MHEHGSPSIHHYIQLPYGKQINSTHSRLIFIFPKAELITQTASTGVDTIDTITCPISDLGKQVSQPASDERPVADLKLQPLET